VVEIGAMAPRSALPKLRKTRSVVDHAVALEVAMALVLSGVPQAKAARKSGVARSTLNDALHRALEDRPSALIIALKKMRKVLLDAVALIDAFTVNVAPQMVGTFSRGAKYSEEEIDRALSLLDEGYSFAVVREKTGIPKSTLFDWRQQRARSGRRRQRRSVRR
jgi:transposase-like protein